MEFPLTAKHISHNHRLIFNKAQKDFSETKKVVCYGCLEPINPEKAFFNCREVGTSSLSVVQAVEKVGRGSSITASPASSNYVYHVLGYHPTYLGKWKMHSCTLTPLAYFLDHLDPIRHGLVTAAEKGRSHYFTDATAANSTYACLVLHHDQHPLTLAFSLPEEYLKFDPNCDICSKGVRPPRWVYYCGPCRFFAHIKCATSEVNSIFKLRSDQIEEAEALDSKVIRLPIPGEFRDQISYLLGTANRGEIQRAQEFTHNSHPHPLILCDDAVTKDDDLILRYVGQYSAYEPLASIVSHGTPDN
ncbi:hypothetical protein RJ640_010669 [Escallonia rubra]|uniref:DC1 domain-containing protein n=1 Tax=Escallonia rubra TaxID=112253 RepID=A0AA88R1G2_9ASTE|nr:hypothetical protein RJ640_010669 [Escallonia rubra]